jgi:hypothetical protein
LPGKPEPATDAEHDDDEAGQGDEFAGQGDNSAKVGVGHGRGEETVYGDAGGSEGEAGQPVAGGGAKGGSHLEMSGMIVT